MATLARYVIVIFVVFGLDTCNATCTGYTTPSSPSLTTVNYIQSPDYPNSYPNYQDCQWTVTASGTNTVYVYIEYESLERAYDFLYIYDDTTLKYTSANYRYYRHDVTSSQTLDVRFTSDYSIQYGGFSLLYMAVDRASLPSCGSTVTATSSQEQLSYDPQEQSSNCVWTIRASSSSNVIRYSIPLMFGVVYVTDDSTGTVYSSYYYSSQEYMSTGDTILVTGSSDSGFVFLYEEVNSAATVATITTTTASNSTSICDNSDVTAYSFDQYVTSPNYPSSYSSNIYCGLTIMAASPNDSVEIEIIDYDVEVNDELLIYQGQSSSYPIDSSSIYTGLTLQSLGAYLYLYFSTNSYSNYRGFKIAYRTTGRSIPSCASSYTTYDITFSSTIIISPNFPNDYSNNLDEYWLLVKSDETATMVLKFLSFNVETELNCQYDYLDIYDGPCMYYDLLDRMCESETVTIYDSSGLYILLYFHTDSSVTRSGFNIDVYLKSNYNPETDESTENEIPDWIYPVIAVALVIVFIIISCTVVYCMNRRSARRVGSSARLVSAAPMKKLTTSEFLAEMQRRYGDSVANQKPKIRRKTGPVKSEHPKPNPPGPNTRVININEHSDHPPPATDGDPAYPPVFMSLGTVMPQEPPVAPTLVSGQVAPDVTLNTDMYKGKVPPAFPYKTPAEARADGTYRPDKVSQ